MLHSMWLLKPAAGRVMDRVARPRADQARVSEVVAADDELVPEPAFPGAARDDPDIQRAAARQSGRVSGGFQN